MRYLLLLTLLIQLHATPLDLDRLIREVKDAAKEYASIDKERETRFLNDKAFRQKELAAAKAEQQQLKAVSVRLNNVIDANEKKLEKLETTLHNRLGNLGELFGVVKQASGELHGILSTSVTTAEYPDRLAFLDRLSAKKELPNGMELRELWTTYLEEMNEAGKIKRFRHAYIDAEGKMQAGEIVRIGLFGAVTNGDFLQYDSETRRLVALPRQPQSSYTSKAAALQEAESGKVAVVIDPTRGAILGMLNQKPTLGERIDQGGTVGYVIILIGLVGMALAAYRYAYLTRVGRAVDSQLKNLGEAHDANPLGRIALVYRTHRDTSVDELEITLDEAILKELPPLEKFHAIIKLFAVVAPLLGLLGTVTGMIATFQAITLFGTGDPKLMAGGISQALVTTVLGLVAAIPLLFLHTLLQEKVRRINDILEQQSAGLLARNITESKAHGSR